MIFRIITTIALEDSLSILAKSIYLRPIISSYDSIYLILSIYNR